MLGIVQNGPTQMIGGQIYESLLRYDDKLEPMPGLAASWTVNDAATVYTFTLKQGVQWHDGKPFNAHDVVFSVDQFLRKTHARLRAGLAFVDSIKALDEHTVEFRLPRPFGPFRAVRGRHHADGAAPYLRRHRLPEQPGQQHAHRHRPVQFRNGGAARTSSWCATSSTTRPACPASTRCTST